MKLKALAILTSKAMYGKERSNIEVYHLAKEKAGYDFHVVVNKKAVKGMLEAVSDLNPIRMTPPERHSKRMRVLVFLLTYIVGNVQLLWILIRLRPKLLMMCSEISFYDFFPALWFYRGKIIYRIGDEPGKYHGLSMKAYNTYVWNHYVMKRMTKVVCISRFIKNCFEREGRDTSNDVVIYNYPPTRKNANKDESSRYMERKSKEGVVFGYLGQLIEHKGVHHYVECALKILERHPDMLFYIAGSLHYDSAFAKRLQGMVPQDKRRNVVFLDEISDISTFFANIEVLCVPSICQEALGNVLVEAKKYGKPCIIYPNGGMPELIRDGIDGYVCDAPNAASLLEKMYHYVDNLPLAQQHGMASFNSINELGIDRENYERKWLEVLKEME